MIDKNREKALTVISLGAGVQSSTIALMAGKGELPPVDCCVFADTGNEPKSLYNYLSFLEKILKFPIHKVGKGNIYNDFLNNIENNVRSPNPPLFTQDKITGKIINII